MTSDVPEIDHETALDYAVHLADRLKNRQTQIRSAFFYRATEADRLPPATELLKNRSHHGLHLKLALFYLWAAGSPNRHFKTGEIHTVRGFSDSEVAGFFGFPATKPDGTPDPNGKRRIANARKRLAGLPPPERKPPPDVKRLSGLSPPENFKLLDIKPREGRTPVIRLLKEDWSEDDYSPPGDKSKVGSGKYHTLPAKFWTSGWHLDLSGSAVVVLLVLEHMRKTKTNPKQTEFWVSPKFRETHFGFSEDTWYKGANELVAHGLATRKTEIIRQAFEDESLRRRYTYEFDIAKLKTTSPKRDPGELVREDEEAEAAFS